MHDGGKGAWQCMWKSKEVVDSATMWPHVLVSNGYLVSLPACHVKDGERVKEGHVNQRSRKRRKKICEMCKRNNVPAFLRYSTKLAEQRC